MLANALQSTVQPTSNNQPQEVTEKAPKTNDTVPQYRPTPIAELERRKRIQQQPLPVKVPIKKGQLLCGAFE